MTKRAGRARYGAGDVIMANATRSEKLDLRLTPEAKRVLNAAAQASRRSVSEFVLESALDRAQEALPDRQHFGQRTRSPERWLRPRLPAFGPSPSTPRMMRHGPSTSASISSRRPAIPCTCSCCCLENAPVHVAVVFADEAAEEGSGLGRHTMPETLRYSVVAAVQTLWLAARAEGLGLGWISILEPDIIHRVLEVPQTWALVAYLCIGWPVEEYLDPELDRHRWQQRLDLTRMIFKR